MEEPRRPTALGPQPPATRPWIGAVVIDCVNLEPMRAFWQAALGYVPRDVPEPDGVVLMDPQGTGPNLSLFASAEEPLEPYRLHLDLYSSSPAAEVDRLVGLGATVRQPRRTGDDFVTLADPDGNVFDVVDKSGWRFGRRA